jgi:hypothetical protein
MTRKPKGTPEKSREKRVVGDEQYQQQSPEKVSDKLVEDHELKRAIVLIKCLEIIARSRDCSTSDVIAILEQEGYTARVTLKKKSTFRPITPTFVTQQLKQLAGELPLLGLRLGTQDRLWLDPAASWYANSAMYKRLEMASEEKDLIAENVHKEIVGYSKDHPLWIYFDAGSTCLACARRLREQIGGWHVLTNNLLLALGLIATNHQKTYLPPGRPDLLTAAVVETHPADLTSWFERFRPEVSVVSFHWLQLESGALVFCSDQHAEQHAKIAGMRFATKAVFIPIDRNKLVEKGTRPHPTVRFEDGNWMDVTRERASLELAASDIYFCLDAPEGQLGAGFEAALASLKKDRRVKILRPGQTRRGRRRGGP